MAFLDIAVYKQDSSDFYNKNPMKVRFFRK